jgi:flap endonuclease-1
MGVNLRGIIIPKEIELEDLRGKSIAIDAYNAIMQFLSIIRLRTGEPLRDSKGRVTSHLSGIFYRNANLLKAGIRPCYVFDGPEKPFKEKVIEEREERRKEAERRYREALKAGKEEEALIYAQQIARVTDEVVESSKSLLQAMGIPWIQAPSEGEAQCAFLCKRKECWAVGSQDWDSLLFGAPRLVRNLNIVGRRKLPRKQVWIKVRPELVELRDVLEELGISKEQLLILGLLVGTDYNPGGVKGIGPKTALKLVRECKSLNKIMKKVDWKFEISPEELYDWYLNPRIKEDYKLSWERVDPPRIYEILCEEHDFSRERIEKAVNELLALEKAGPQKGLREFIK